jgi:hypothetical protein
MHSKFKTTGQYTGDVFQFNREKITGLNFKKLITLNELQNIDEEIEEDANFEEKESNSSSNDDE